jgi:hypothetical protein
MSTSYLPKVSRRETLKWFAAASVASALPQFGQAESKTVVAFQPTREGYGTDPHLNHPSVPWPLILDAQQLKQAAVLADLILPGSATAPAPSALGVADFINEWVSAPYPDQREDRAIIVEGLRETDAQARSRAQRSFLEMDEESRQKLVGDIARNSADPAAGPRNFFRRFRYLVVGAYYTTPEGFKDIGYTGNVPLASYPRIADEERAILEKALSNLGLSYA